ncbi:FkbM family methyltransferase [Caballeronia telluris]|uniref:FkbM family methyltransferase n=1 Tax=Caballeronia telluris TaxID=326475 RepID=A0A158KD84_9BURK|nr:FkbM family methyltransferase [Caballeronia telluris]SAL78500.1 FkbM family methyltransferase [Caballeronia telluris]
MPPDFVPTVSYAQNAEDIVLLRALAHVERGFYVDVGAWDATEDSVTRAFYERGWCGINIEPQPGHIDSFRAERPRDINLALAISDQPGQLSIWVPRYSALATCRREMLAPHIPNYGDATEHVVDAVRLDALLREHAHGREIHFLKIDVEGYESAVIESANFDEHRPVILIVEATSPHDNAPCWHGWEPRLLASGYRFALFDGLNRFYVREESKALLPTLAVPANCLDGFVTRREMRLRRELYEARSLLARHGLEANANHTGES